MNVVRKVKEKLLQRYIWYDRYQSTSEALEFSNVTVDLPKNPCAKCGKKVMRDESSFLSQFIESINQGDIVFDIGAKYGIFSCFGGKKSNGGKIVAFEPMTGPALRTRENMVKNGINGTVVNAALTNSDHDLPDWLSRSDADIDLVSGDTFVEDQSIQPNVMKIDTEGSEKFVVEGLTSTLSSEVCRAIFIEVHPKGCFSAEGYGNVGLSQSEIRSMKSQIEDLGFQLEVIESREEQSFLMGMKDSE